MRYTFTNCHLPTKSINSYTVRPLIATKQPASKNIWLATIGINLKFDRAGFRHLQPVLGYPHKLSPTFETFPTPLGVIKGETIPSPPSCHALRPPGRLFTPARHRRHARRLGPRPRPVVSAHLRPLQHLHSRGSMITLHHIPQARLRP